tara:strand:+ start:199 stop:567 length:369 start_codon:yes stop_codon:yes gene_type:complete
MALTVSGFTSNTLPFKLIMDDGSGQNSVTVFNGNVTGSAGNLYSINVINVNTVMYLKIWVEADAVQTADPDIKIQIASGATEEIIIPGGLAFNELSFVVTQTSLIGSQTAPGGAVAVKMVTS